MSELGMALSKVLFEHEPTLLVCDLEATARAAAQVSNLLGCVLANVMIKYPDGYEEIFKAVVAKIDESARDTLIKAANMTPNLTPH
jgi:hypothetical protein